MMNDQQLQDLERRSWRGLEQDGLTDVCVGILLALAGLALGHSGLMVLVVMSPVFMVPALRQLRRRWTEPRVGYAKPRQDPPARLARGMALWMVACTLAVIVAMMVVRGAPPGVAVWRQWMPLWASLLISGGFIHAAGRSGLWRYHWYTGLALASGLSFSLLPTPQPYAQLSAHLLLVGLAVGLTGFVTFVHFLRHHPVLEAGEPNVG